MGMWGLFVLRVALGVIFIAHGFPKLMPMWGSSPEVAAAYFESIGLRPAHQFVAASGVLEAAGGLMLTFGFFTTWATLALILDTLFALWKVHWPHGLFLNWTNQPGVGHGMEYGLVVLAGLICLILAGPGALSIEGRRARDAESEAFARARLRSGKV